MRVVVKIGGSLLKSDVPQPLIADLAAVSSSSELFVVHGGGDLVTNMASRLGKEQRFVVSPGGVRSRYTDRETAEIYAMVMSGLVAMRLVMSFAQERVKAVSLSGFDGQILQARRKERLVVVDERGRRISMDGGYTGKIESVNSSLLLQMASLGCVPVLSPVAVGDGVVPLNVDGDRAASAIASSLRADSVVFMTNVEGLIIDGKVVTRLNSSEAQILLPRIGHGMQKKVMAAVEAVRGGAREAMICSGLGGSPVTDALSRKNCTVVVP